MPLYICILQEKCTFLSALCFILMLSTKENTATLCMLSCSPFVPLRQFICRPTVHLCVRENKQAGKHLYISTRGHAIQVHVCVSVPCVVIVLLTILPCVTGAACFVLFDCSFTASAITHELLPYSDVCCRAVVEQRAALKTQTELYCLLCLKQLVFHL